MQYKQLGSTGVMVSTLAYGTMPFGGAVDEAMAKTLYTRCRDAGINHFDCADVYEGGRAEEVLGRLITGSRDELVITTKAYFPTGGDVNARGASRYHLTRALEASLRRLGTERVDIFYLHRFDERVRLDETLRALEDFVRQGKVLYLGASNFAAWQIARALGVAEARGWTPFSCIQPMYNLGKRTAEIELLPMAAHEQLAVFPYGPLGGGLLSGKYGRARRPERGRLMENPMYQTRYADARYYELAERFTALARAHEVHPATLAIAWVMSHPAVTAPLIGARSQEQLEPLLAAAEFTLTPELRASVSLLSPEPAPATDRNEEGSSHNYAAITRERASG
ncbi:MAG: aldo/keto reductase [Myxococcales bacterium]|nr:aldo/keto reductase [Myxococcales bacterium]